MRNYVNEMEQWLAAACPGGRAQAAPLVAARLIARLRAEDPDLLDGWLRAKAPAILADHLTEQRDAA